MMKEILVYSVCKKADIESRQGSNYVCNNLECLDYGLPKSIESFARHFANPDDV